MKKLPSKADIRDEIARQVEDFLRAGGDVKEVPRGVSAWTQSNPIDFRKVVFERPKEERTYLNEVVAALDARKAGNRLSKTKSRKKPGKKLIYDDFGEPLRWVWEDSDAQS